MREGSWAIGSATKGELGERALFEVVELAVVAMSLRLSKGLASATGERAELAGMAKAKGTLYHFRGS